MNRSLFEEEMIDLRARDLYRELRVIEGAGPCGLWKGKRIALFCGNDYLGLSRHPRVIEAAKKALEAYGVGAGASRLISGTSPAHEMLEQKLARFKKTESVLVYSAGYLANLGVLTAVAGPGTSIIMDKLCHASLIDGARLSGATVRVFPHKNYTRCKEIIERISGGEHKILVSETLFSMDGDFADIPELIRIKEKYGCLLLLDDAHGTGVLGKSGSGGAEGVIGQDKIDIMTGTLSKALGALGGFAATSKRMTQYLINRSRAFIFATALPPSLCAAASEAICVVEEEPAIRQALWDNMEFLRGALQPFGFSLDKERSPIFPLVLGEEKKALEVSARLLEEGFFIPAIRYPTVPKGKARLRLTVSAIHKTEDLKDLLGALKKVLQEAS